MKHVSRDLMRFGESQNKTPDVVKGEVSRKFAVISKPKNV